MTFLKIFRKSPFLQKRTMIDINLLRKDRGGNPDMVKESQRKRGGDKAVALIDEILAIDDTWIKTKYATDNINKDINIVGKKIAPFAKAKQLDSPEAIELKNEQEKLKTLKAKKLEEVDMIEKELFKKLRLVGNIVHSDVVDSKDEVDNKVLTKWWPEGKTEASETKRKEEMVKDGKGKLGLLAHNEVLETIGGYDPARGMIVLM
jgi:seryl-tRNA synthetase